MDEHAEAASQTEPVVVLSLAQAAVLGLISQSGLLGATISNSSFHKDKLRPQDSPDYDCTDPLIGANGDYLDRCLANGILPLPCSSMRHQLRPFSKGRSPVRQGGATGPEEQMKQEGPFSMPSLCSPAFGCSSAPTEGLQAVDSPSFRLPLKQELLRDTGPIDEGAEGTQGVNTGGHDGKVEDDRGTQMTGPCETGVRCVTWEGQADSDGQPRPRPQLDRLDVNVQIDESYCVDVGEGLRRWKCRLCEKSYTSKYNLVTHILGHNGVKPHGCAHCGKLFKQPSHLQTHLLTHQGARPHRCAVCERAFTQTSHLKRHMLQHSDVKPYSCRFCTRGFAYPSELRAHEAKHRAGAGAGRGQCYECSHCGLELPSRTHLKRHQAIHQGPTAYHCPQCHVSFTYRSQLQNHMAKHQDSRAFVCSECGIEFSQGHHLKQHALTHKVTKGFRCEVCSREFTLSANLKRHMLIHARVRPYQCHICFKTFVQKQTLKTHMIVHLPVKPFKCKVCGKSFNRMYNLLGHMHLHAGSRPFKCPYCSSKFNLKGNLSRHLKVKHSIADVPLGLKEAHSTMDNQVFNAHVNLTGTGSLVDSTAQPNAVERTVQTVVTGETL